MVNAFEGHADLAVDQGNRKCAGLRRLDRGAHLGARDDPELFCHALLICPQRQVRGHQGRLALANHLEEIHLRDGVRIDDGVVAAGAQFHRDGIVTAALDQGPGRVRARSRNMRGAEQRDYRAVFADDLRKRFTVRLDGRCRRCYGRRWHLQVRASPVRTSDDEELEVSGNPNPADGFCAALHRAKFAGFIEAAYSKGGVIVSAFSVGAH